MAEDVQRLLLQIDASATLLRQEVAKARGDIDGFANRAERKLSGLNSSFDGVGRAAGAAAGKIAGMAAALLSVSQAASFTVRANADFQRLSAQLEVATGSTQRAAMAMSDLQAFAAETPFTLGQVVEGFVRLKNLGLDPSIEAMRSFGNTSAAMGKDVMQFIEAVADAATGEFERLKEFGIKASKEGDKVKFTFQGVTTTVENSAQAIAGYLKSLGDESGAFAGSMAKQMDTIDGKLSNLQDAAARLAVAVGNMGFTNFFMSQLDKLARIMSGAAAVLNTQGFLALMKGGVQGVQEAATPQGLRAQMMGRVNEAQAGLIEAERVRVFGRAQPQMVARAKAELDARYRELVAFERANPALSDPMMRFGLNDDGSFGKAPTPQAAPASSKTKAAPKTRAAKQPADFTPANMEYGWALRQLLEAGTPANVELTNEALQGVAETMRELADYDFSIDLIDRQQVQLAEDYTRTLTEGLAQAVVFGRNFGDVLKGLAQQILSSGLISILSGGKFGTSFGSSLGALGSIFGGFRAEGGPIEKGKAYIVGEKRPEVFVPDERGKILPRVPDMAGDLLKPKMPDMPLPAPEQSPELSRAARALMQSMLEKFGGFRAEGGPVSLGKAYVVGERGPELFVPKASGFIAPNGSGTAQQGNGATDVRVTVEPSPLLITTVEAATRAASADAMRRATRPRMIASPGA